MTTLRELAVSLSPAWLRRLLQGGAGGVLAFIGLLMFGDPARHPKPPAPSPDLSSPASAGDMTVSVATFQALKRSWELRVRQDVIMDLLNVLEVPSTQSNAIHHLRGQLVPQGGGR